MTNNRVLIHGAYPRGLDTGSESYPRLAMAGHEVARAITSTAHDGGMRCPPAAAGKPAGRGGGRIALPGGAARCRPGGRQAAAAIWWCARRLSSRANE